MKTFKTELERIIDVNKGARFVIHPTSKREKDDLFEVMEKLDVIAIGPDNLQQYRENAEESYGDDAAFEMNMSTFTTSFGTVEHWKQYTRDIIEWKGDGFEFIA